MSIQVTSTQYSSATAIHTRLVASSSLTTQMLTDEHKQEILAFLAERPLHTVFLAGCIRDNGLVSSLNRGSFYAYHNQYGRLEGVALIGRATLIEARSESALAAFANLTRSDSLTNIVMGEEHKVERFWHHYAKDGEQPRLVCRNLLLEQRCPATASESSLEIRIATLDDLSQIMAVNAEMFVESSGVNPLKIDPAGFRMRTARRIEQERVWVLTENERLIFKADVIAETPEAVYLECIYVTPQERGKGYARNCLIQLCRNLLASTQAVCLLVEEKNEEAQNLYRKVGFEFRSYYNTIHMHHPGN